MRSISLGLLFFFLISACAPSLRHHRRVEKKLLSHQYDQADRLVEKNKEGYGNRNRVLYYLDRGMVLHLAGRYKASNAFFEKADAEMERLYTQSLSTHVGALLTNDNLLPYEGEDFEKVLIHVFSALNYAALGEWEEALVEARQVDAKLNRLNDRYDKKNVYKADAFARYLAGILYEGNSEVNDAFISYRKAYEAFKDYERDYRTPIPERIGGDLLRLASDLHFEAEFETYRKIFPDAINNAEKRQRRTSGEIVVIAYAGRSPLKEDFFIHAPVFDDNRRYLLRIAMPKFAPRPSRVSGVDIILRQGAAVIRRELDLLEDITAIAKKNLEDRVARITAKAIARASSKYFAVRAARRKAGEKGDVQADRLIGLLGNLFTLATERSDKRSWRTLPGKIYLGRVALTEGEWEAEVRYHAVSGGVAEARLFPGLLIQNKKKAFLIVQAAH
ncbi:MAG: COG3014 family protein [Nitrospiria bacterium]